MTERELAVARLKLWYETELQRLAAEHKQKQHALEIEVSRRMNALPPATKEDRHDY